MLSYIITLTLPLVIHSTGVLAKDASALLRSLLRTFSVPAVRVDELAAVMIDLAMNEGSEQWC
jgi:hypothetical protein